MTELPENTDKNWERETMREVLLAHINEQKRARRWGIFFKLAFLAYLVAMPFFFMKKDLTPTTGKTDHTAVIDVRGLILDEEEASAENLISALEDAFSSQYAKGVILRINSPGGSAVQSRQVFEAVKRQKLKKPNMKVYAVITDMGTSGAYLIASAADAIYSDQASIIGSIGVRMDSFGFVDTLKKIGAERRLYTAGKYKGMLDPFSPRVPEEEAFINEQLRSVHLQFIDNVKRGRGTKLKEHPDLFSGLFWTGENALKLGLIDGFGDTKFVAKELIKAETLVDYTQSPTLIERLTHHLGTTAAKALVSTLNVQLHGVR